MKSISVTVNGVPHRLNVDEDRRLLWVLRDDLGLTGTKFGCGVSACGACTVIVDGKAVHACVTTMKAVDGKQVTTIEGLASGDHLAPVQQGFVDHLGFQCGYCTSGMIMGGHALLMGNAKPTRDEIAKGMEGHLCRCGAHVRIVDAIEAASHAAASGGAK
jgi:aerobic-type carbon monoxide dehydrogenase small subunit (CoxS/CutS family)